MSPNRFDHLLSLVEEEIRPKVSNFRQGLSAEQKLLITLRYLSTGDSQQSQSFNFSIGRSTVSSVIKQTCAVIWSKLGEHYVQFPTKETDWQQIADGFRDEWNLPHVLGALDGMLFCIELEVAV